MGKKNKKKYTKWIKTGRFNADRNDDDLDMVPVATTYDLPQQSRELCGKRIPRGMLLPMCEKPGFFLGLPIESGYEDFIGIPMGTEGNVMVIGGNGCGKSTGLAMPTLRTWQGAICATDIKGELSDFYGTLVQEKYVSRPMLIFDPMQIDGPSYDPFDWLLQDDESHLVSNIWEIALAILPILPNDNQPFWAETERAVLAAALLHYFKRGLSFSEAITIIAAQPLSTLCERLMEGNDVHVRVFLGETAAMKPETLVNVDRGLRNKLMLFAADPYISHAFRGRREGANCFTWEDLDTHNVFLRIPANKIEEWGGAINLMYTQLIRHLERRPEMHSSAGTNNPQTLLLMDEFARFGKLEGSTTGELFSITANFKRSYGLTMPTHRNISVS